MKCKECGNEFQPSVFVAHNGLCLDCVILALENERREAEFKRDIWFYDPPPGTRDPCDILIESDIRAEQILIDPESEAQPDE